MFLSLAKFNTITLGQVVHKLKGGSYMQNLKSGDIVKLKSGLVIGKKYGGMELEIDAVFKGNAKVVWSNSFGLLKLNNGFYYTDKMVVKI